MHSVGAAHLIDESTTIVSLVQRSVYSRPQAIAIVHGHRRWTYRQLDELANALAWELTRCGGASASLIPLVAGEGIELPLAVIATLKLGVPWVPIDMAWPPALIARCLSEIDPAVTVCTAAGANVVTGDEVLIDLETLAPRADAPEPRRRPRADDIVYGFYTSGSSGAPKCALNLHGGVLNRLLAMTRCFADEGAVVLQNSRSAFDSSIWQLLWPLTRGSTVIIPSRDGILDLEATIGEIARHGVTMTDFVPSVLNVLIKLIEARPDLRRQMTSLRRILVGGEALSPHTVTAVQALLPDTELTNTYGATECSIGSIWYPIDRETHARAARPIPIGRAIDNTAAIILDDSLTPVAPRELGEIYLGGLCVGAGYLGDEHRSRESFVRNPCPDIPGPTLYRTGDLGYMDQAGGNIYYGGRIDDEVKLNGARANLGDIEMVLRRCPQVADASVVACDEDERTRLIAYVVARSGQDATGIRQYLSRVVPHELMPSRIVTIDRIPLSGNGKVDRRALAALAPPAVEQPLTRSIGSVEQEMIDVWTRILRPERPIDLEDNFFDLGGDSLDLQRLVADLQGVIGRPVSIREVADRPTVRGLSQLNKCPENRATPAADGYLDAVKADLVLPVDVRAPAGVRRSFRYVLLTGATGFVGAHLLSALLTETPARVLCLVRADDAQAAVQRLQSALGQQRLDLDRHWSRVDIAVGDLTLPLLGLQETHYAKFAEQLDTIVHCGAVINLLLDYSWHRPVNVLGTREIIRLAAAGTPKHLHYVSSLAAHRTIPGTYGAPATGYARSKWVAEKLLGLAAERGVSSSAYRLSEVLPHSGTGSCSSNGLIDSTVRAFVELGVYFSTDATIDYVPVDVAARAIVAATGRGIQHRRFDVLGHPPLRLGALFSAIAGACGLRQVSYLEFWSRLHDRRVGGRRSDERLLTVLPNPDKLQKRDPLRDLFGDPTPAAVPARTELVDATSVEWPPASRLVASWADAWRDRRTAYEGHAAGR
jgi:amino acid adenylation domain-containing protein/thioester reductase-like protein